MAKAASPLQDMMSANLASKAATTDPAEVSQAPAKKAVVPAATSGRAGIEKVTVYLPKAAYRFIKQAALDLDQKPHDLLINGVDLMLRKHGKKLSDFSR